PYPDSSRLLSTPVFDSEPVERFAALRPSSVQRKSMRKIKTAVLGSGFMGAAHVEGLRRVPGVEVVAISSIDRPKAEELCAQFAIPTLYDDWQEILSNPEIEAVHNCTPNNL